ncbi:MAG: ABC transporter permease [Chloroflexota bacterium]
MAGFSFPRSQKRDTRPTNSPDIQRAPADDRPLSWLGISPRSLLILIVDLALLLVVWHLAAVQIDANFLPTPGAAFQAFAERINQGEMVDHALISTRRVVVSIAIGAGLALPLAVLTAQLRTLDQLLTPLLYFIYPAPKIVFLPLILFAFGLYGDTSRVFLISLVIFFQVFVIVRDAAVQVRPETLESLNSLGAGWWQRMRYVYIPVTVPAVITALKISTGTAIAVLYISEGIAGRTGLGYFIQDSFSNVRYPDIYAGIIAISALGLALFTVFWVAERYLTRWQRSG